MTGWVRLHRVRGRSLGGAIVSVLQGGRRISPGKPRSTLVQAELRVRRGRIGWNNGCGGAGSRSRGGDESQTLTASGVQRGRGRGAICRARMRRRRRIGVDPWRGIIDTARILGSSHGRGIGVSLALGGLYGKGVGCHLPSCVRPALSPPCLGGLTVALLGASRVSIYVV